MRNTRVLALAVFLSSTLAPVLARADNDSLLTLGFGASAGVSRRLMNDSFVGDLKARLRVLRLLGAEVSYSPPGWHDAAVVPGGGSTVSASALVYVLPTRLMSMYAKIGLDAASLGELSLGRHHSAYHAGGGIDFALGSHAVLAAELVLTHGAPPAGVEPSLRSLSMDDYRASWSLLWFL